MIKAQLEAVFDDIRIDAIKIGMLSCEKTILEIVKVLEKHPSIPVIVDTIMISSSGYRLLDKSAMDIFIKKLIPIATLLTPNIPEAIELTKMKIDTISHMKVAAKKIYLTFGCKNVLLKGGHLSGDAIDILYDGKEFTEFKKRKINSQNTHGTGCALSSAITANLAKGHDVKCSINLAKEYISEAIKSGFKIGNGIGQLNHLCNIKDYGYE